MHTMIAMLDPASLNDTVGEFLREAAQLHHSLLATHNCTFDATTPGSEVQPRNAVVSLRSIVQRLETWPFSTSTALSIESLASCCLIISRDLLVHLGRFDLDEPLNRLMLHAHWPLQDVEALGERLKEFLAQWHLLCHAQQ